MSNVTLADLQALDLSRMGNWMGEDSDQWVGTGEAFRQKLYQALWTPESLAERVAIYPAYLKRPIEQIPSFEVWLALAQVQGMEIGPD